MKKAEVVEFGKQLKFCDDVLPDCPPNGAIVKVSYCGICQSDITIWNPSEAFKELIPLPHVLGHEIAGYIHQLGDGEDEGNLAIGDRVGVYILCQCGGICGHCKDGQEPLCEVGFHNVIGVTMRGGYASHVLVPNKKFIMKLPDNIPTQVGAVVGCAGITSYSAVCEVKETANQKLKLKGKASLLLIGCGGLGQWAIIAAKAVLPGVKVVVADINENKLKLGRELGVDDTIHWSDDVNEETLLKVTRSKGTSGCEIIGNEFGFDCVIDFVGNIQTMTRAMNIMHIGGLVVLIGISNNNIAANFPTALFLQRGYTLKGRSYGTLQEYKELMEILGKTKPPKLPGIKLFDFENATNALELVKNGKISSRAVLKIAEAE